MNFKALVMIFNSDYLERVYRDIVNKNMGDSGIDFLGYRIWIECVEIDDGYSYIEIYRIADPCGEMLMYDSEDGSSVLARIFEDIDEYLGQWLYTRHINGKKGGLIME